MPTAPAAAGRHPAQLRDAGRAGGRARPRRASAALLGPCLRRRQPQDDTRRSCVTDARLVWDTWRRILTSDALVEAAVQSKPSDPAVLALAAQERAVFADYASTPVPADTMVSMFRRGLVRNALTALNLVPMTRRLLYTSGLDAATVAEEFVKSIGYRDDGPYFWRGAADFVAYLATAPGDRESG